MSYLRIRALQTLSDCIEDRVPRLRGNVCAGWSKHANHDTYPQLGVISTNATYYPDQFLEHNAPSPSVGVFNIGRVEANLQLRLGCANRDERYVLEDMILHNVFFQDIDRPGIFKFTVSDCEDALVACELETFTWEDDLGLEDKWFSSILLTLQMPVLVRKVGVYCINEIRLQLTEDLDSAVSVIDPSDIEETVIDENFGG